MRHEGGILGFYRVPGRAYLPGLLIADQERQAQAGVESIPRYKIALRSSLHADRSLVSSNRSYSRSER